MRIKIVGSSALALLLATAAFSNISAQAAIKAPQKIISLSPSATEILFGIGAGPQVLAVDDNSDYPTNAPHSSLSSYSPNVEAIAAMHPDLVVLQTTANNASAVEAGLKELNINVYLESTPTTIDQAFPGHQRVFE